MTEWHVARLPVDATSWPVLTALTCLYGLPTDTASSIAQLDVPLMRKRNDDNGEGMGDGLSAEASLIGVSLALDDSCTRVWQ